MKGCVIYVIFLILDLLQYNHDLMQKWDTIREENSYCDANAIEATLVEHGWMK